MEDSHTVTEDADEQRDPCTENRLVEANLSPGAALGASAVAASLIDATERRICSVFLGTQQYGRYGALHDDLMANLLLECLPAFVHEQKGEIAYAVRLDRQGDPINPAQSTVTVNNQVRPYLMEGYLFIHLPRQRVVVSRGLLNSMCGRTFYEVAIRASGNPSKFQKEWEEYARRHNYLRGQAFFADGEILDRRKAYDWKSIHLPEDTRKMIQNHVDHFFRHSGLLRQLGVKPRRGLILSGPPGTGKTLLGKVLADTLGVSFMWVLPRHVKETESFTCVLNAARFVAPAVVFLEDIDLFAEEREGNASTGLGELMNQLDGAVDNEDIVTIATTNRLDVIEKALRNRPGRFDRIVEIGAMDEVCRRNQLHRLLASANIASGDFNHLVAVSEGYTGAQVEELVNTLYILAVLEDNFSMAQADPSVKPVVPISRQVIEAGLDEFRVERKTKLGFHAA